MTISYGLCTHTVIDQLTLLSTNESVVVVSSAKNMFTEQYIFLWRSQSHWIQQILHSMCYQVRLPFFLPSNDTIRMKGD